MMLYNAPYPAPNPRRVTLFLAEKNISLPVTELSLRHGEQRAPEMLALNPRGQVPFLVLDDGQVIAESVSICRYLDELHPEPPLFGSDAAERALTDMWIRRVETKLGGPVGGFWLHGHPLMAKRLDQIPAYAQSSRQLAIEALRWFDGQLAGHEWLAGDRYSLADIVLLTTVDFAAWIGIPLDDDNRALLDWHRRATARYPLAITPPQ